MKPANKFFNLGTIASTTTSDAFELELQTGYAVQVIADVNTPSAKVFTAANVTAGTDEVEITSHGFPVGLKVQLTTTGVLPTGLATSTDYFIIVIDANTIQFASSLANALAGTAIDIAADGSGDNTVTAVSLAGGAFKIQGTCMKPAEQNDQIARQWTDIATETANITADGTFLVLKDISHLRAIRLSATLTAGSVAVSCWINSK